MEALFYLFSVVERAPQRPDGSGRSPLNGYLVVGVLAMLVLSSKPKQSRARSRRPSRLSSPELNKVSCTRGVHWYPPRATH